MKEEYFESLCSKNLIYCSQKQQKDSRKKTSKLDIPLTTPTYVHLFVELIPHSAAVQICISPFSIEGYHNQTFFSSKYRYCPCCTKAPQEIGEEVKKAVQYVYDNLLQVGRWDVSDSTSFTIDNFDSSFNSTSRISKASCQRQTSSALCKYFNSDYTSPTLGGQRRELPTDPRLPQVPQRVDTDNDQVPRSAQVPEDLRTLNTEVNPEEAADDVNNLVASALVKLRRGLEDLHQETSPIPDFLNRASHSDKAEFYEAHLWEKARNTRGDVLEGSKWLFSFLASCFGLVQVPFENENGNEDTYKKNKVRTKEYYWRIAAEMINSIVNGLYQHWNWRALLIYSALKGTGFNFTSCSRLGVSKRKEVVSILVEKLRDSIPSCDDAMPVFNPALLISSILSIDYTEVCRRLKLDTLQSVDWDGSNASWDTKLLERDHCALIRDNQLGQKNFKADDASAKPGTLSTNEGEEEGQSGISRSRLDDTRPSKKRKADNESETNTRSSDHNTQNTYRTPTEHTSTSCASQLVQGGASLPDERANPNSPSRHRRFANDQDQTFDTNSCLTMNQGFASAPETQHNIPEGPRLILNESFNILSNQVGQVGIFTLEQDLWDPSSIGEFDFTNMTNANFDLTGLQGYPFNSTKPLVSVPVSRLPAGTLEQDRRTWNMNPLPNLGPPTSIFAQDVPAVQPPLALATSIWAREQDWGAQY